MTTYAIEVTIDGRALFRTTSTDRTPYEVKRLAEEFRDKWPNAKVEVIEQTVTLTVKEPP